ncbi:MAG: MFS transporter [Bacillota bacterium]|jgi:PPP family 3-phenylpropionic acid transporter
MERSKDRSTARTGIPALYFTCFVGLGVYFTYGNVFLRSKGVSVNEIGLLTSIYFASALIGQPIFGYLYDELPGKSHLILTGCALAGGTFAAFIPLQDSSLIRALLMFSFSFFSSALLPLLDAEALRFSGAMGKSFQALRTWGSVGFLFATVAGGVFMTVLPLSWSYYGLAACLGIFTLLMVLFNATGLLPRYDTPVADTQRRRIRLADVYEAFMSRPFLVLLGLTFCYRLVLTGPMNFLSMYLTGIGLGTQHVGVAYALTGVSEVAVLYVGDWLKRRASPDSLMVTAIFLAGLRWIVTAFTHNVVLLLAIQCLHGVNFILFYVTAVQRVDESVKPHLLGLGQTVFGSVFYGLGPVVGAAIAGPAVSTMGYASYFVWCSIGSFALTGLYILYLVVARRLQGRFDTL